MSSRLGPCWQVGMLLSLIAGASSAGMTAAGPRTLTFEERVAAQADIERPRYAHQIGATRPFDEAVPRAVLERKVRTYLEQSVALEKFWRTPVTAEMLRRETERMTAGSRMPDRLAELFRALGNDPFLIQECLARPALVDRLARNFFSFDRSLHEAPRMQAETLRARLANGKNAAEGDVPRPDIVDVLREAGPSTEADFPRASKESGGLPEAVGTLTLRPEEYDRRRAIAPRNVGDVGPIVEEREAFVVRVLLEEDSRHFRLATYTTPKTAWDAWWDAVRGSLDTGEGRVAVVAGDEAPPPLRRSVGGSQPDESLPPTGESLAVDGFPSAESVPCFQDDTWNNGSLEDVPDGRHDHTAIWTGSVMVIWGGFNGEIPFDSGGRYDPATDTWAPVSRKSAPEARRGHTAVWTGSLMIVWGGVDPRSGAVFDTGDRYDPVADRWTPVTSVGAPAPRQDAVAVWTGSVMVVWGGANDSYVNSGGRYDPEQNSWLPVNTANAPSARILHRAVWTGTQMVVWGGFDDSYSYVSTGGRYDPDADAWSATSTTNAPQGRCAHTAVWAGSVMVVWGGYNDTSYFRTGGRYDPVGNTWSATSTTNAPSARSDHTAIWTGSRMLVWGGQDDAYLAESGGEYSPVSNTWWNRPSLGNAPAPRAAHTAIWTGALMVVWGGSGYNTEHDSGGRYNPSSDSWTPTARSSNPAARIHHTAVWTGNDMIVWGGDMLNTGGRYDPVIDGWNPTSTTNAPAGRRQHVAVWAGSLMVVWGGSTGYADLNTGGRYDPLTDSWTATSTVDAPTGRSDLVTVWTGKEMIVWGGYASPGGYSRTGGRYDPRTDRWTAISTVDAPSGRTRFTAVWTGSRMIVWGGYGPTGDTNTGGQYDPHADTWTATTTLGAPVPREWPTAVWTGSTMLVWGGFNGSLGPVECYIKTGGRYDPASDQWGAMTALTNAPAGRYGHTAVWAGDLMIVWGGQGLGPGNQRTYFDTGGRYSPAKDTWVATPAEFAPSPRSLHSALWAGHEMIVWGGLSGSRLRSGGMLAYGSTADLDADDFSMCQGDCNDTDPSIHPGALEACNGIDDDCDGVIDDGAGPPSATTGFRFASVTDLTWLPAAGGRSYDVVKGDLALLHDTGGSFASSILGCLQDNLAALICQDANPPAGGDGYYYLVRAVGCGQNGTYDTGSISQIAPRDPGIAASGAACP